MGETNVSVRIVNFTFNCHGDDHFNTMMEWIGEADIFNMRGTGTNVDGTTTKMALVNVLRNQGCDKMVLKLQYEVIQNRLIYIGVCGGPKFAGDTVDVGRGIFQRGLQLFGRGVNVAYESWEIW